jgi:hypothetical protein
MLASGVAAGRQRHAPDSIPALQQLAELDRDERIGLDGTPRLCAARQQLPRILTGARVRFRHRHRRRHDAFHRTARMLRVAAHVDLRDPRSIRRAVQIDRP